MSLGNFKPKKKGLAAMKTATPAKPKPPVSAIRAAQAKRAGAKKKRTPVAPTKKGLAGITSRRKALAEAEMYLSRASEEYTATGDAEKVLFLKVDALERNGKKHGMKWYKLHPLWKAAEKANDRAYASLHNASARLKSLK